jgi:hypothetical protein
MVRLTLPNVNDDAFRADSVSEIGEVDEFTAPTLQAQSNAVKKPAERANREGTTKV